MPWGIRRDAGAPAGPRPPHWVDHGGKPGCVWPLSWKPGTLWPFTRCVLSLGGRGPAVRPDSLPWKGRDLGQAFL